MKKQSKVIMLSAMLASFYGCSNGAKEGINNKETDGAVATIDTLPGKQWNEKAVKSQVGNFLKWYKTKYDTLSTIMLVSIPDTDDGIYAVNFKNTEEYLKAFAKSGFFTHAFIEEKRDYFKSCNERMLKAKQNEGPPIGLEHDIILLTQEIDEALNSIDNASFSNYAESNNSAFIEVTILYKRKVHLLNEKNKWLIDKIEFALPD